MATAPQSISITGQAHPIDCLDWNEDRLVYVSSGKVALIPVAPANKLDRPHELTPNFSEIGEPRYICETEDALCLPENSLGRLIDAVYSPFGIGRHRSRLLAVLTADRRCAIYAPTKHPDKDPWQMRHSLVKMGFRRLNVDFGETIKDIALIKHLRVTSVAWTPAFSHTQNAWGSSFLLAGNEAGELQVYRVSWNSLDLLSSIKCSDAGITHIRTASWSMDGRLAIFLSTSDGTVHRVIMQSAQNEGRVGIADLTLFTIPTKSPRLVSNMACSSDNTGLCTVAVARPGLVEVVSVGNELDAVTTLQYSLPYYGPVGGLCWSEAGHDKLLFVFGSSGSVLCLKYNVEAGTLNLAEQMTKQITKTTDQLLRKAIESVGDVTCKYMLCYHGAAVSPHSMLLALAYSMKPVNRIQYMIPSSYITHFTTMSITDDMNRDLQSSLTSYLHDPYSISLSAISHLHKRAKVSLLSSLDNLLQNKIVTSETSTLHTPFQGDHIVNNHRMALFSNDLDPDIASQIHKALQLEYLQWALNLAQRNGDLTGQEARKTIRRLAGYVLTYLEAHEDLQVLAISIVRKLDSFGSKHDAPDALDVCPACQAEVTVESSMSTSRCLNGHVWSCCSLTLETLSTMDARTCLGCGKKAVLPGPNVVEAGFYEDLLQACDMCFYCTGKWYTKF